MFWYSLTISFQMQVTKTKTQSSDNLHKLENYPLRPTWKKINL